MTKIIIMSLTLFMGGACLISMLYSLDHGRYISAIINGVCVLINGYNFCRTGELE